MRGESLLGVGKYLVFHQGLRTPPTRGSASSWFPPKLSTGKTSTVEPLGSASRRRPAMARDARWQHRRIAGNSLERKLPTCHGNIGRGRVNDPGYGNNAWALDNPQPVS